MAIVRGLAGNDRDTSRLEAFSDGVIAIAITLLILEVRVPHVNEGELDGQSLWSALGDLWPSYLGYGLSFAVIGIMWANHHAIFKHIVRTTHYLVLLNLLLLFMIAFIPFPTALLAEYLTHDNERTAVIVYAAWILATALVYNGLWRYVRTAGLIDPETDHTAVATINRRFNMGPAGYLIALIAAIIWPPAGLALQAILALLYVLPENSKL